MFQIDSKFSSAVRTLYANPITGSVKVRFRGGSKQYRFTGVSRRAILSAVIMPPVSAGQWVNCHCLASHVTL